jgi:hypothetical protein
VNCYFCGELVDERECVPADPWNDNTRKQFDKFKEVFSDLKEAQ